jgi:phage terminase large subunit-like protein
VFLPQEAHWLGEFQKEVMAFPRAPSDDQVDALSQGLAYVSYLRSTQVGWAIVDSGFY